MQGRIVEKWSYCNKCFYKLGNKVNLWTYVTYEIDKLSAVLSVFGSIVEYLLVFDGFSSQLGTHGIGHGVCHFLGVIPSISSIILMINKQKVKDRMHSNQ